MGLEIRHRFVAGRGGYRIMTRLRTVLMAAGLLAASGCNFAPHYDRPKLDSGDKFKEAVHGDTGNEGWQLADPRDAALRGNWWEIYGDPTLNELEERVANSNQSVLAAEANYRSSRAMVQQAEAAFFPTVGLDPSVTRSRSSASVETLGGGSATSSTTSGTGTGTTTGGTTTGGTTTGGTTTGTSSGVVAGGSVTPHTIFSLPVEASYQVDLWGSIRNTVAQNRFTAQASAATLANTLLSTQTTLAQDYFQLRIADEERRVLDNTLEDFQANLHLVQTLYKNGVDSDEDLAQAQTQLQSAMASATDLGVTRATFEHAIAVLIGVAPSSFSLPYVHFNQSLPPVPVGGVPADLIERRPDIAAAERQVAATNAAIGVARAAFFPTLSLTGSAGYESTALSQLLKWPNRFWSIGPDLAQTLFDGGARRAALAQARAANDAAAATYRQTVLTALQGVEDNLASLRILSQELVQEHDATVSAQRAVELSVVRYRNGVDSYVNVITAQNAFLTARESEVQLELRQLTASVNLINNLGGGWSTDQWQKTEKLALQGSSEPAKLPQGTAQGVPNPPPMPEHEIKPDELLKQNEEVMGGRAPASP
jgi:NodT family efflux transporter outer membrane factor (OMF) lipoprotein